MFSVLSNFMNCAYNVLFNNFIFPDPRTSQGSHIVSRYNVSLVFPDLEQSLTFSLSFMTMEFSRSTDLLFCGIVHNYCLNTSYDYIQIIHFQ